MMVAVSAMTLVSEAARLSRSVIAYFGTTRPSLAAVSAMMLAWGNLRCYRSATALSVTTREDTAAGLFLALEIPKGLSRRSAIVTLVAIPLPPLGGASTTTHH